MFAASVSKHPWLPKFPGQREDGPQCSDRTMTRSFMATCMPPSPWRAMRTIIPSLPRIIDRLPICACLTARTIKPYVLFTHPRARVPRACQHASPLLSLCGQISFSVAIELLLLGSAYFVSRQRHMNLHRAMSVLTSPCMVFEQSAGVANLPLHSALDPVSYQQLNVSMYTLGSTQNIGVLLLRAWINPIDTPIRTQVSEGRSVNVE
ncbi:hypothetical protein J3458_005389 [Metarhizium acridum]|uniref:uncharacterized protein n=1 Tax=Metarhizium acridum TaxID=92637 RepID=UPI001C6B38F8|nr:hypothetical protein J3458_005389 [Metarhizium acridum]